MTVDRVVENGLREAGLVNLVVTVAPVADEVDYAVASVQTTIVGSNVRGFRDCVQHVAVRVQDETVRRLEGARAVF